MALFSRNLKLGPPLKLSGWRKVAIGTWKTVGDPSVYGSLHLEIGPALEYLEDIRKKTGIKVTLTHFIGKALAQMIAKHPQINCVLRFGKLYPRKSVDVFFQVANDNAGKDLSGTTIRDAHLKSIAAIALEMQEKVHAIRAKGDPAFNRMKSAFTFVPGVLARTIINLTGFLMYSLNLWSPIFGSPKDPFGSVMLTNVGALGLDAGYAPLVPYSRVPLLIAVGAVKDNPIVRDGKIQIAKTCQLCVTFDHRLIDGMHASHMVKTLTQIFANPAQELLNEQSPLPIKEPVLAP